MYWSKNKSSSNSQRETLKGVFRRGSNKVHGVLDNGNKLGGETKTRKRNEQLLCCGRGEEEQANIVRLCGESGADFEGQAVVKKGKGNNLLGLHFGLPFSGLSVGERSRKEYIIIKGPCIFVYSTASAPAPKYSIPLQHETVERKEIRSNSQVVVLKTGLGIVEYEFKFDLTEDKDLGKKFTRTLKQQIDVAKIESAKERLGHCLGPRSKSMIFAKMLAKEKELDQPVKVMKAIDVDALEQAMMMRGWSY